jgi:hypothetical protein
MMPPEKTLWRILCPFDVREGVDLATAAARAGKSETTVRNWCNQHGLGRRVGGGTWVVSKVALAMFLDGDLKALDAYRSGDRSSAVVSLYFQRCGVPLPHSSSAKSAQLAKSATLAGTA